MYRTFILILLSFLFNSIVLVASQQEPQKLLPDYINLVVPVDHGNTRWRNCDMGYFYDSGMWGATVLKMKRALEHKVPMVTHASLFDMLIGRQEYVGSLSRKARKEYDKTTSYWAEEARKILRAEYEVRTNLTNDFCVCVPKKDLEKYSLEDWGFDTSNLKEFDHFSISANLPYSLEHFKALFNKRPINRRMFVNGHGCVNSIVMMRQQEYAAFLNTLNDLSAQIVYISTCGAGGLNLSTMHKGLSLKFPLIMGSSTDGATANKKIIDFTVFFESLKLFLEDPYMVTLHEALSKSHSDVYTPSSIPQIRLPGEGKSFRAANVDGLILGITPQRLQGDRYRFHNHAVPISHAGATNVLFYAGHVDVPCCFLSRYPSHWLSMVGGNAYHVLDQVEEWVPEIDGTLPLKSLLQKCKNPDDDHHGQVGVYWRGIVYPYSFYKTFFIKKLLQEPPGFQTHEYENVAACLYKNHVEVVAKVVKSPSHPTLQGSYVSMESDSDVAQVISQAAALKRMRQMIRNAQPDAQAFEYATEGAETLESLKAALPEELRSSDNFISRNCTII